MLGIRLVRRGFLRLYSKFPSWRNLLDSTSSQTQDNSTFFGNVFFVWVTPLLREVGQHSWEPDKIWTLLVDQRADILHLRFAAAASASQRVNARRDWLVLALFKTCKTAVFAGGVLQLVAAVLQVCVPVMIRLLIDSVTLSHESGTIKGAVLSTVGYRVTLAVALSALQMLQMLCTAHCMFQGAVLGAQVRAILMAAIHRQAVTTRAMDRVKSEEGNGRQGESVSHAEKPEGWTRDGQILNLIDVDVSRIDRFCATMHLIWTTTLQLLASMAVLFMNLGPAGLIGFALMIIIVPVMGLGMVFAGRQRYRASKLGDQRTNIVLEALRAVRVFKILVWEPRFLERFFTIRKAETRQIVFLLTTKSLVISLMMTIPSLASVASFTAASSSTTRFNAASVFSSMAVFVSLRTPISLLGTMALQLVDAHKSACRIQSFLAEGEAITRIGRSSVTNGPAIVIERGEFSWNPDQPSSQLGSDRASEADIVKSKHASQEKQAIGRTKIDEFKRSIDSNSVSCPREASFKLGEISLTVAPRQRVGITGRIGSGKSTLLAAIAGEVALTGGFISLQSSSLAYCSQEGFFINGTVRENILFGQKLDEAWFGEVIEASGLSPDLQTFPYGDQTEIGENGVMLSGGQRQRINIARAIYRQADILLLDEPFSSVDMKVARHIFQQAVMKLSNDSCCVIATHQLHLLRDMDKIVWLDQGKIHRTGSFQQLFDSEPQFRELLGTTTDTKPLEQDADIIKEIKQSSHESNNTHTAPSIMDQEARADGGISAAVYDKYAEACGPRWSMTLPVLLLTSGQASYALASVWLSHWTRDHLDIDNTWAAGVYAALCVLQTSFLSLFSTTVTVLCLNGSMSLSHRAMQSVMSAPMWFFDTASIGGIANRLCRDVDIIDTALPESIILFGLAASSVAAAFILMCSIHPQLAIAILPLAYLCFKLTMYFLGPAQRLKSYEAALRRVLLSQAHEAVKGSSVLRAYGCTDYFSKRINKTTDNVNSTYLLHAACQRWLALRLDLISCLCLLIVSLLVVIGPQSPDPNAAGLAISYVVSVAQLTQLTMKQVAEVDGNMSATERICQYADKLPKEEDGQSHNRIPSNWPRTGAITFRDVALKYRHSSSYALREVNIAICAGERVGIVGRTGAGKSSFLSALFRLVELSSGDITIDGENIAEIDKSTLRSRLAIVPQDLVLVSGDIRSNIDPLHIHSDEKVQEALVRVGISAVDDSRFALSAPVDPFAEAYSPGEKQLLSIARVILQESQVIVCDEATSALSFEAEDACQKALLSASEGKTLISVSHRLKTILNYDRIIVLDHGKVIEFDNPVKLWDLDGPFRSMCTLLGIDRDILLNSRT